MKKENKTRLLLNRVKLCCRSANYNNKTGECVMSNMDRITLAGSSAFQPNEGIIRSHIAQIDLYVSFSLRMELHSLFIFQIPTTWRTTALKSPLSYANSRKWVVAFWRLWIPCTKMYRLLRNAESSVWIHRSAAILTTMVTLVTMFAVSLITLEPLLPIFRC